jgi:hypothetical protein
MNKKNKTLLEASLELKRSCSRFGEAKREFMRAFEASIDARIDDDINRDSFREKFGERMTGGYRQSM